MKESNHTTPPTIVSLVAQRIQDDILGGKYSAGSSLPEIPLAREMEISRGAVREALRSLADTGLVELNSQRGAAVASFSPQRINEVFSLRAVLESFAVKTAIMSGRISGEAARNIEDAYETMSQAAKSEDKIAKIDAAMGFHWSICAPCGHDLLLENLKDLQIQTRLCLFYIKVYGKDGKVDVQSHQPILRAVFSGEVDQAEAAVREHIINGGQRLLLDMLQAEQDKNKSRKKRRSPIKKKL
jgi:DNA-binding GntR family transcriptional regulator